MGAIITKATANHEPAKLSSSHNGDRSANHSKGCCHKCAFNYSFKSSCSSCGLTSVNCYPENGYDSEFEQFINPNGIISLYQSQKGF